MGENDRSAARVAKLREHLGPDPVPSQPAGLDVSAQEWKEAWKAVLDFGLHVTDSLAHASDLRQETYERLLTTRRWTPERTTTFVRHMVLTASSLLKDKRKAQKRRDHYEAEWGAEHKRERGVTTASPEHDVLDHAQNETRRQWAARVLAELRRRLADFPLELRLIDHVEQLEAAGDELEKPAELAKSLGVRVDEVYRALERIRRYKQGVVAAAGGSGEESGDGEANS